MNMFPSAIGGGFTTSQAAQIVAGRNRVIEFDDPTALDDDTLTAVLDTVYEMDRAAEKHGDHTAYPRRTFERWFSIIAEEHGEAAKEVVELGSLHEQERWLDPEYQQRLDNLYAELTQEAAMCLKTMAWLRWKGLVTCQSV